MDKKAFIAQVARLVQKHAPAYGIKVHSAIIAQAICESGWGTSELATKAQNYFGLKYRKNRCKTCIGVYNKVGFEQNDDGSYTHSDMQWCKFRNLEDCVIGYFDFTNIPLYSKIKGIKDPQKYLEALQAAGYATAHDFIPVLMNIIKQNNLTQYDKEVKTMGKPKVCIDPGHFGKYNPCPNNSAYYESEVMWKLHLLQKKYLEMLGIEVITTRKDPNKDLNLQARGQTAKGCDLFISDHSNAVGSYMSENTDYVAVFHMVNDTTTDVDDRSRVIAERLAKVIAKTMGTKQPGRSLDRKIDSDRNGDGIMNDNYYGVIHAARTVNVPGLLVEHSFHTNTRMVNWMLNDANLDKLARAEAECIASWLLGKTVKVPTSSGGAATKPTTNTNTEKAEVYRVRKDWDDASSQKGAYKTLKNAKACADKNPGYFVFDEKGKVIYPEKAEPAFEPYLVKVNTNLLNIRKGPGTNYGVAGTIRRNEVYTIVDESNGWGKLKSGAGWISLNFTIKA